MSAMLDDWAFQSVYEAFEPPQTEQKPKRSRAMSIVKSVAHAGAAIPAPEVRPRANTTADPTKVPSQTTTTANTTNKAQDTPLTSDQLKKAWDRDAWLGSLSPAEYDFDERVWEAQVAQYRRARDSTSLAARLARDDERQARSLLTETDWLVHEVRDTREHDLAPLHTASQRKRGLNEQIATADSVRNALATVWDAQERIERELRGPAPKAVPKLAQIINDIDAALAFCAEHPDFLGIEQVATALRTSAQRALAVAVAYTSHELSRVASRLAKRVSEPQTTTAAAGSGTNSSGGGGGGARQALFYTKFKADTSKLQPVVSLVRANTVSRVYWEDVQTTYFRVRSDLIARSEAELFAAPVSAAGSSSASHVTPEFIEAAQTALVQFKQLCVSEQAVFESVMGGTVTPEFWNWFRDEICDPLYSAMRRVIVHETDIAKLGELIVLLQAANDEDKPNSEEEGDAGDAVTADTDDDMRGPFASIHQDAQNRLIFRANLVVDKLAKYEPVPKDFLKARFPTVERTLDLLGQVYQLLNSRVFNELAHRCVRECLASLDNAVANRLSTTQTAASTGREAVRIHIFHIRQLLVLQSQIVEFDLQNTVVQEVDFSGIQQLLSRDATRSFRDLISLAWESVPRVVEVMFDAMEELYASLRRAVDRMCSVFVALVWASLDNETDAPKFRDVIAAEFRTLLSDIRERITDADVVHFLVDSVQEAIMDKYTVYYRGLQPSQLEENDSIMDIDTMASWLSATIAEIR